MESGTKESLDQGCELPRSRLPAAPQLLYASVYVCHKLINNEQFLLQTLERKGWVTDCSLHEPRGVTKSETCE